MMAVADEVGIADLDQLDRRQADPAQMRPRDADPTLLGVLLEWVELEVEIVAAPLAAADLADGYGLRPGRATIADGTGGLNCVQVEQLFPCRGQSAAWLARADCRVVGMPLCWSVDQPWHTSARSTTRPAS
jgi:hypothetical protein